MNGGACASASLSAARAGFDARVVPRAGPRKTRHVGENGATRRSRRTVFSNRAAGLVVAPRRRAGRGSARALPRDDGGVTTAPEERADEPADAPEDATDGDGWWAWTKRWALWESSEEEDAVESPAARSVDDAASTATAPAGEPEGEAAFFERVPLPPWLRVQVDRVLAPREDERTSEDARPRPSPARPSSPSSTTTTSARTTRPSPPSGAADISDDSMMEAFAEALDGGALVGDATVNRSGELAATATEAAIEKLSSALAAVEARERAAAAARAAEAASDDLSRKAAAAAAAAGSGSNDSRDGSAEADVRSAELADALSTARRRAEEAREAAAALAAAVDEVARARGALDDESASEATGARARRAISAAGERLRDAASASRAAAAAAGASFLRVAAAETDAETETEMSDSSAAELDPGAFAAKTWEEWTAAVELSDTFSRIAEWSARRTQAIFGAKEETTAEEAETFGAEPSPSSKLASSPGSSSSSFADVSKSGRSGSSAFSSTKKKPSETPSAAEIGKMIKPALLRVVAQSLEPSSPEDLRAARVACGLAAWIYYLPTAQRSLPRFGLRVLVSSLDHPSKIKNANADAASSNAGSSNASSSSNPNRSNAGDAEQERAAARRAMAAADAAIEELTRASSLSERGVVGGSIEAAREAARLAEAVARQLEAMRDDAGDATDDRSDTAARTKNDLDDATPSSSSSSSSFPSTNNVVARGGSSTRSSSSTNGSSSLPVNYCVAADDVTGELWVVIEGSTSLASWQTNLTFQPVTFEDPSLDVRVHRGSYDAARLIYDDIRAAVAEHVKAFGRRARIHVTGHSIGGSLAMLLALMLVLRKDAPREAMADVWTFGAPYVLCGGDALLARMGLPRRFVRGVAMGKDIVPRSFSCYYPAWARKALEIAPGSLKVDLGRQASFLEEEMFYSPMGDMYLLQAMHGSAHPLLPPGPGLYALGGEGMYEMLVRRVKADADADAEDDAAEEDWMVKRGARGWGEMTGEDSSDEEEDHRHRTTSDGRDGSGRDGSGSGRGGREPSPDVLSSSSFEPSSSSSRRLNRLACLTQSDAALTAGLILGSVDSRALLSENSDGIASLLQERGRDAARRVVLNTPHPLTVLSDPRAYGNQGSISRHHNPFNYLRALGKTRRVWEGGSQPWQNDFAEALKSDSRSGGGSAPR